MSAHSSSCCDNISRTNFNKIHPSHVPLATVNFFIYSCFTHIFFSHFLALHLSCINLSPPSSNHIATYKQCKIVQVLGQVQDFSEGFQDTYQLRRTPVGVFCRLEHFKIQVLRNGISGILRQIQCVVMSHFVLVVFNHNPETPRSIQDVKPFDEELNAAVP